LGEGDGVAEGFELADVAAGLAVLVGAVLVPVGAEFVVAGVAVGQEVPDDDGDGAGDGDLGSGGSAAAGDAGVPLADERRGAGGAGGGLAEVAAQVGVPGFLPGPGAGAGLDGAGAQPGPRDQVVSGGEPGHVQA